MLVDLHAHFPMHLLADEQQRTHERARAWWRQRIQGMVVDVISRIANYQGPGDTPSVTPTLMRDGDVGIVLSMLYQPFNEMDLEQRYGAPPREHYFTDVIDQREVVEDYAKAHPDEVAIAHSPQELRALRSEGIPILIHAIEGGFQVGRDVDEIRRNVRILADLGVAYITVAHLFFRDIATNAPALPFLSDRLYNWLFPQKRDLGLTTLGRQLVEAMLDEGILIDITHMRKKSIADVFDLLEARDPHKEIPVIGTHIAYSFGGLQYSLDDETIKRVADRGGLLGCILCEHYITNGLSAVDKSLEGSVEALCRHIDKIHDLTGSYDNVAIGSDLDGYIKPALPGLEDMSRMAALQHALHSRYGDEDGEKICSANALRVLEQQWGRKRPRTSTQDAHGG